jgi:ABC-type Fe3+-hydroxamate transport system substrate-binding protein
LRRKSTLSVVLIGALLAVVLVAGCGSSAEKGKEARPTVFVDDLGREVEIAEVPQSIVSIAPSCTRSSSPSGWGTR